jgi:hypothetical protein
MSATPNVVPALRREVERLETAIAAKVRRGQDVPGHFYAALGNARRRLGAALPCLTPDQ